jgi:RNA polymerase sigma-70 factor (ECF subfamily)
MNWGNQSTFDLLKNAVINGGSYDEVFKIVIDDVKPILLYKGLSEDDAKDLFQTVALKFCQYAGRLRGRHTFFPWLFRVLQSAHCDMVAERHSTYAMSRFGSKIENFYALPEERSVFHKFASDPESDFETLFSVLNPLERMIVEMTYVGGFPTEEICSVIGLSNNAVRKRRHFAIQKMRKAVFHIE